MPMYEYRCENCEAKFSAWATMEDRTKPQPCSHCQALGRRVLSATRVFGEYEAYECPVEGKMVEGRVKHRENLKRTGCRLFEPGEKRQWLEEKRARQEGFEKAVGDTMGKAIADLPPEKQQKLATELEHFTLKVERSTPDA